MSRGRTGGTDELRRRAHAAEPEGRSGDVHPALGVQDEPSAVAALLGLQRTSGNQAVQRMLASQRGPAGRVAKPTLQRGEAAVHQGIEVEATAGSAAQSQQEMYAGNWMRDFSQLNLPRAHNIVKHLPKDVSQPHGEKIGAAGAEDIVTAVIRGLAFLHFGVETTETLVTAENIGRYTPEQHVDNPMGTTAADHLVRDTTTGELRTGAESFRMETEYANGVPVAQSPTYDPDRDRELAGKAFPGLQVENPALYAVSDAGLGKHIYNAIEWAKSQLAQAAAAGATPQGRMFLGSALHAVEDYYAHSNFIEVALNSEVGRALEKPPPGAQKRAPYSRAFLERAKAQRAETGAFVDTLYDAKSPSGRMAVTTGTAGTQDLYVSIGQIVLPKLPKLSDMIDKKIDEALNLVVKSEGKTTWEEIQDALKTDEGGHAMLEIVNALDRHVSVPIYDFWLTEGIELPFTDRYIPTNLPGGRFIPTGWDTSESTGGVVQGIRHYIALYRRITGYLDDLKTGINIAIPITMLFNLKKQFMKWFNDQIKALSDAIKQRKNELLLSLVAEITGIDLKEAKRRGIHDVVEHAGHEGVEHLRGGTSIEARLEEIKKEQEGAEFGDERLYAAYGIVEGKPMHALPPSHSEISKDHPPHTEGSWLAAPLGQLAALNPEYTVEEGSLFYGLHKALAKEADSHIIDKMQAVWNDQVQQTSMADLRGTPALDRDQVLEEARDLRKVEERRAEKEGRTSRSYSEQGAGVAEVMTLVELFISHPDDSSWWKPIVREYVNAHEAEVLKHIRERNRTRAHRH